MRYLRVFAAIATLTMVSALIVGCSENQPTVPESQQVANQQLRQIGPFYFDIKPMSCPNPLNVKSKGKTPAAILGTDIGDVTLIDVSTILLEGSVVPIRASIEDVSTPYVAREVCGCTQDGPDGFDDLTLKFLTQDIVALLGEVEFGDVITLTITGNLADGTPFEAADCVVIRGAPKPPEEEDPFLPLTSPENVLHNLALSYSLMDCEHFQALLCEDFVFVFNPDDVESYPDLLPPEGFWGYSDELEATCRMLDPNFVPTDPTLKVDRIELHLQLSGPLQPTNLEGAPDGTLEGYVLLDLCIEAGGGSLTLLVRSRPLFYFAPDFTQNPALWCLWRCEDSPFDEPCLSGGGGAYRFRLENRPRLESQSAGPVPERSRNRFADRLSSGIGDELQSGLPSGPVYGLSASNTAAGKAISWGIVKALYRKE